MRALEALRPALDNALDLHLVGQSFELLGKIQAFHGERAGSLESFQVAIKAASACGDAMTEGNAHMAPDNGKRPLGCRPRSSDEFQVVLIPPLRDFDSMREPHAAFMLRVVDEFRQRRASRGLPNQPGVQSHTHHAGMSRTFVP